MDSLTHLARLWQHRLWADAALFQALRREPEARDAWREYAHILGAESVWLTRLRGEEQRVPVWPDLAPAEVSALGDEVRAGYEAYLTGLDAAQLGRRVAYVNSAGKPFEDAVGDILLHVMLHGQYHRGKINLLLRQAGAEPAPVDYIAFVRGSAAARTQPPTVGWA